MSATYLESTVVSCPKCGDSFPTVGMRAIRVRNSKCCTSEERFWQKVRKSAGCWIWLGCVDGWGYGQAGVNGKRKQAHRYSYELAHGPIPAGMVVMHSCDTAACVNPSHLSIGTHADNQADMRSKGRNAKGEQYPQAKLTTADAISILKQKPERRGRDGRAIKLAAKYGVRVGQIHAIWGRRQWKHIHE